MLHVTVPSGPPADVQPISKNSTSILVRWGSVDADKQNGIIQSYTVSYKALPSGSLQTKVVLPSTTQTALTGLNEDTTYSITVFANTSKGAGPEYTPALEVTTDEDSKYPRALLK